ncbi:hypothetical protein BBO99_00003675 [Phytophthora kernoviae]|uniref:Uncharacterized protein n=2 Tax=Phytophthora kernoviae TaxID=325452 RepID=A0A3R7IGJ6_9STRA|nr:hypothetical protein G195_006089 [Phytophthora kernoviae 00238/432]KAG2523497.1 hypothetical protein JM16_002264 [Phytophthora kernoviae]KAG2525417.1 hypothetical protein JM18_002348 [Phytophthora kernoviae]RLN10486.1 hypothetical protein BBI17_003707 [Phytophthora kernoviae]RLN81469.1 hypothetical protein BBO99_00003675 [Phytophthora kernoviae]
MSSDMLKNLLILQHQASKTLIVEFHQQTEAYIQQFKRLPTSQGPAEAAHDVKIPLRELSSTSPSLTEGYHLEAFLDTAKKAIKTVEDRVHFLFVLDATLAKSRQNPSSSGLKEGEMLGRFESKQGYVLLVEWFAECCSYKDETSKAFVELLLLVLQRNVPGQQFTRKKLLRDLSNYKKFLKGKKNKELFQTLTDKYRDSLNSNS